MNRIRRATGWLIAATLLASTVVAASPAPASASGPGTSSILSAVNSSRAGAGRRALSLRADLSAVAYRWSQRMAASNTLKHNPNLTAQVSSWRWVGENVGYGPDWRTVQAAFMSSPGHRANILDRDYSQIGIGVVASGGRVWITQVFRAPSGSTAAAPPRSKPTTTRRPATRPSTQGTATSRRPAGPKPAPTPAQQLERRITAAKAQHGDRVVGDPLLAALGFAAAMRTVGG